MRRSGLLKTAKITPRPCCRIGSIPWICASLSAGAAKPN